MFKEQFITRHLDLVTPKQLSAPIVIVGAGAIGSFVTLALTKMGFHNIAVYDFDTVENENIGNQFFPIDAVGMPKVHALAKTCVDFSGTKITAVNDKIGPGGFIQGEILISAVDSMEVRKMLYEKCATRTLIDPRMGAEYATLEVVDMSSAERRKQYEQTLYSDKDAVQERCTAKTTIYTVLLIAGQVVKAVLDSTGETKPSAVRTLDWNIKENAMLAFSTSGFKL
jgi:molybdopterin/thiamine biosynthesis adenylyltransferase